MKSHATIIDSVKPVNKPFNRLFAAAALLITTITPFQASVAGNYQSNAYVSAVESNITVDSPNVYYTFPASCKGSPSFQTQARWNLTSTAGDYVDLRSVQIRATPKHNALLYEWYFYSGGIEFAAADDEVFVAGKSTWNNVDRLSPRNGVKWRKNSGGTYLSLQSTFDYENLPNSYSCTNIIFLYNLYRR